MNYMFPVMPTRRIHYLRLGWIVIKNRTRRMMLPFQFILIAAMRKAMAYTLKHQLDTSIFSKLDSKIWNPKVSLDYVKLLRFTQYSPDALQLLNSGMNVMVCFAYSVPLGAMPWDWKFCVTGAVFNSPINTINNKILKRKKTNQ